MKRKFTTERSQQIEKEFKERIKKAICQLCKIGVYRQHHDNPNEFLKCPICGHTIKKEI